MANAVAKTNKAQIERLKHAISSDTVQQQFKNALAENAGPFTASVIDLYNGDTNLQKCDPSLVIMEALKAATLKLPINRSLGFAYVIPYGNVPTFQIGYKGLLQLAMRTGQYKFLNAGIVSEGQTVERNQLTGETKIVGEPKRNAKPVGYFAYMQLINGFTKTVYMTAEEVTAHGKRFSKSFSKNASPWKTDFDAMALKTCVRRLLTKWGIMSVEMAQAITQDTDEDVQAEIDANANGEIIDIEPVTGEIGPGESDGDENDQESDAVAPTGPGY